MAAPAYVSNGGIGATDASTTVAVPFPASIASGDILLLQLVSGNNSVDHQTPSGFSSICTQIAQSTNASFSWWWKRADGTESGNLTCSRTSSTLQFSGVMSRWTGAIASGTPYNVVTPATVGRSTTCTSSAITPTYDAASVICMIQVEDNVSIAQLSGGNYVERFEVTSATGDDTEIALDSFTQTTATAEVARTATVGGTDSWGQVTLALWSGTGVTRHLTATVAAVTTTASAAMGVTRHLSATVAAVTTTASAAMGVTRHLAATVAAVTATGGGTTYTNIASMEQVDAVYLSYNGKNATPDYTSASEIQSMPETCSIGRIALWLRKFGTPTGNIWITLRGDDAGTPGATLTNGTSSSVDVSTITGDAAGQQVVFTFPTAPSVTSSSNYYVVIGFDWSLDNTNYVRWFGHASTVTGWSYWDIYQDGTETENSYATTYTIFYKVEVGGAALTISDHLSATVAAVTVTAAVNLDATSVVHFAATSAASTTTANAAANVTRHLASTVAAETTTAAASLNVTGIVHFAATVAAATTTAGATLGVTRHLASTVAAVTTTASAALTMAVQFYICNGGTAMTRENANGSGGLSTYMSAATHNGLSTMVPGDTVYLSNYNGDIAQQLTPPTSGTAAQPIHYIALNDAILTGGSTRDYCIYIVGKSYLHFVDVELTSATTHNVYIIQNGTGPLYGLTFNGVRSHASSGMGFMTNAAASNEIVDLLVEDCRFDHNADTGLGLGAYTQNFTLRRVQSDHNAQNGTKADCAGIRPVCAPDNGWVIYGGLIEHCLTYSNGKDDGGSTVNTQAMGIWLDTLGDNSGSNPCIVRYNRSYDNVTSGFHAENCDNSRWYGNVSYGNGDKGLWFSCTVTAYPSQYNVAYNNTCYGNSIGIQNSGNWGVTGTETSVSNIFKNNISTGNTSRELKVLAGSENVHGANGWGSGNVYERNCFGAQGTNFLEWALTGYATYDAWLAASGQTDNNIEVEPDFSDAANGILWLKGTSTCRNAGENLGTTYDDALSRTSVWPDGVVTLDQDDYGTGWEIGAYVSDLVELTATVAAATTTASAAMAVTRHLIATVAAVTTTADVALKATRHLAATVAGVTTTADASLSVSGAYHLTSTVAAVTTTANVAATITRHLLTTAEASSVTASAALAVVRHLAATSAAVTTTGSAALEIADHLSATVAAASTTASAALAVTRHLACTSAAVTTTGAAALTISDHFAATVAAVTTTASAAVNVVRHLASTVAASTVTADANLVIQGAAHFTATVAAATTTASAALAVVRHLSGTVAAVTTTADAILTTTRHLAATSAASTTTPSVILGVTRHLASTTAAETTTAAANLNITGQAHLTATVAAVTTTAGAAMAVIRHLAGTVAADTTTATPVLSITRHLASMAVASTTTASAALGVVRHLVSTTAAETVTANANLSMTGHVDLIATVAASTTTASAGLSVVRHLAAAPAAATEAAAALSVQRHLSTEVVALSETANAVLMAIRNLSATISAETVTANARLYVQGAGWEQLILGISPVNVDSILGADRLLIDKVLGTHQ